MFRKFSYVIALLIIVTLLASCAQPTPTTAPVETAAPEQPTAPPEATAAPAEKTVAPAEKVTITWSTIAGFYTDWAEEVAKDFEEATGYDVEVIDIDFPQLYEKQVLEMVGGTGAYDIITYDVGWKAEFAHSGYLLPLDDYIAASDPKDIEFEDIAPALIELTTRWQGKVFGLPYYTFTMGMFYCLRSQVWLSTGCTADLRTTSRHRRVLHSQEGRNIGWKGVRSGLLRDWLDGRSFPSHPG